MTHGESILVIEDDSEMQELVKALLEMEGYSVFTATSGADALKILRSEARLSLILLDRTLPDMAAPLFLERKRAENLADTTPIVFFSAAADLELMKLPAGVVGAIQKPFPIQDLLKTVKTFKRSLTLSPQSP